MKAQKAINIIVWTVTAITGVAVATDALMTLFGLSRSIQYAFNAVWFCLIAPGAIALSDVVEWAHPEFFGEESTNKNRQI